MSCAPRRDNDLRGVSNIRRVGDTVTTMTNALTARDSVGRRLLASRALAGMDQQTIADAIGVSRTTVSGWERGKFEPTFTSIVRWAQVTNQPLDWFAEGLTADVVRPKGLEPLTFWLVANEDVDTFWTADRSSAYDSIVCQAILDAESHDRGVVS